MRTIHVAVIMAGMGLAGAITASAQTSTPGFLTVNVGVGQPSPKTFSRALSGPGGDATVLQTDYGVKAAPTFDIGGGVFVRPRLAVGIAVAHYTDKQPSAVSLTTPGPSVPTRTVSSSLQSDPLTRDETGVHIQLGYLVPTGRAVSLLVFGGPSHITARQQFISTLDIESTSYDPRTGDFAFKLCCAQAESEKASAWGFNVGGDFAYFLTKTVGVGALIRYSRATVDITDPIQSSMRARPVTEPLDVGGFTTGAGLRLRF